MSALGQKQTLEKVRLMSLYRRKRTLMSVDQCRQSGLDEQEQICPLTHCRPAAKSEQRFACEPLGKLPVAVGEVSWAAETMSDELASLRL